MAFAWAYRIKEEIDLRIRYIVSQMGLIPELVDNLAIS
jgi:hypothetical protein